MGVIFLEDPIEIVTRSGWQFALNFWDGYPPDAVIDDLTGYKSVIALTPQSMPGALPLEFSTDAGDISISEGTVKVHLHNIYEKLGVDGRLELTLCAQQKGLL